MLSHWLAKSFSAPCFVESMNLFGNACIANFQKHFKIGKCAFKAYISSRLCISKKEPSPILFFKFVEEVWYQFLKWYQTWDDQLFNSWENGVRWDVILYRKSMRSKSVVWFHLRGYCTSGSYFWRLCAFSQKIKQLRTKYSMDLVRNVPRNSKITVLLQ